MSSQIRVLHVDDDPGFLDLSRTVFGRQGNELEVSTAISGTDALELMESTDFDCIVSDSVTLPDGTFFVEAARERDDGVPIVLFTAKSWDDVASEAASADVSEYVRKAETGDFETLLTRLEQLTGFERGTVRKPSPDVPVFDGNWRQVEQYEWGAGEELGTVIVEAIERHVDDASSLSPLYDHVDADAVEQAIRPDTAGEPRDVTVRFHYEGFDVLVTGEGVVAIRSTDAACE